VRVRKLSTIIIDPSQVFRAGLEQLLHRGRYRVIASCGDLGELSKLTLTPGQTALFILSIGEVTQKDGEAVRDIKGRYPAARIVVMGGGFSTQQIALALRSGADACLLTTLTFDSLAQALDLIMLGGTVLSEGLRLFPDGAQPASIPISSPRWSNRRRHARGPRYPIESFRS